MPIDRNPCLSLAGLLPVMLLAACEDAPANQAAIDAAPDPVAQEAPVPPGEERHVIAFGDSLFAGYNVATDAAYPAVLEEALRARGVNARVVNAGVSGDTSAAGLQRLRFVLDSQAEKPDLFILSLGGNDLLRGLSPAETRANLDAILGELAARDIEVLIYGLRAPPNYGPEFQQQFDDLYPALAREYDAGFVPFWVESVADRPDLIQPDRIHPTEEGIVELVGATADEVAAALDEPAEPGSS
jgi:acyl-CoA thioesterase-1